MSIRSYSSPIQQLVVFLLLCVLLCHAAAAAQGGGSTYEKHRVTSLPGYGPLNDIVSYAGYMSVQDNQRKGGMFYWFYEKQGSNASGTVESTPVILWVNGGPGCSAFIGCFEENIGPFDIQNDLTLTNNPFTWMHKFHVLFIDQPLGTGFSYAEDEQSYTENQKQGSLDMYNALHSFFQLHPKYKNCDLYLSGESYAGKYLPELAYRIVSTQSPDNHLVKIFKGVAIGDGFSAPMLQRMVKGNQVYYNGLISQKQNLQYQTLEAECIRHIQGGNTTEEGSPCDEMKSFVLLTSGLINVYDVRRFDPSTNKTRLEEYLNLPETRSAIHATKEDSHHFKDRYVSCNSNKVYYYLRNDILRDVRELFPILAKHVKVLLFSGNFDLQDGPVGTEQYVNSIANQLGDYSSSPRNLWFVENDVAGYEQSSGNFTFMSVFGSGHFYPHDQKRNARSMMESFTSSTPFCAPGQAIPIKYKTQAPSEYLPLMKDPSTGKYMLPCEIHQFVCNTVLKGCNGHGKCVGGACQCDFGFTGEQCLEPLHSLKRGENTKKADLHPQGWSYHLLDIKSDTFDQNVLKLTVKWQNSKEQITPLSDQIGEGLGNNLPSQKVCLYGKRDHMPSWNSFDFVICEQEFNQIHFSKIVDLGNRTTTMPQWWIGLFNAQPNTLAYSLEFNQDYATEKPVNLLKNFKFWIVLFSASTFIAVVALVATVFLRRAQDKDNGSFSRLN